ncbi:hypothetical protein GCM10010104_50470 [Streptomyces indiaensis]|uniref:Uncharacterized protein n=1 Tax=Streptomyces indiaensis TaxID=284033 RepID=A0ABN3E550_9ACTN
MTKALGANTSGMVLKPSSSPAVTVVVSTDRGGGDGGYGCAEAAGAPITGAAMRTAVVATDARAARHLRNAVMVFDLLDFAPARACSGLGFLS